MSRSTEKIASYLPSGKKVMKKPFFEPSKDSGISLSRARMAVFYTNIHEDEHIREEFHRKKHLMKNMNYVVSHAKRVSIDMASLKYPA